MAATLARVCLVLLVVLVASSATVCDAAVASQAYELQRRMGSAGTWSTIASFTLSRASPQSAPRLKNVVPAEKDLSKDEKNGLTSADLINYRVIAEGKPEEQHVMVAVSPCSIIRGFEAVDSSTVVLREKLRISPGPGTSIVGLQVTSETNFFHSKMIHGDECDLSVVQKLFPTVRIKAEVGLLSSVELSSKVSYTDLRAFVGEDGSAVKPGSAPAAKAQQKPKKTAVRRVKNADGEWVEEEVEVDERSFIQKYWMYFAIPIVMSVIQNIGKK